MRTLALGRGARRDAAIIALLMFCANSWGSEPPAKVALTGGRIIPVVGEEIASGTILIEHGKITAIGEKVELPHDAMEVDVTGKVLLPGLIDAHNWQGLDVPNENADVAPYLDVYDAIDPSRLFFENSLRDGVTAVHIIQANNCVIGGASRVVRPIGLDVDEMTIKPRVALKLSTTPKGGFDRMLQMSTLRETFLELKDYLERLAEQRYEEEQKKAKKDVDVGPAQARKLGKELIRPEDYDDQHASLVELTSGRIDAWIYAGAAMDVGSAVKLAKDNGFFDHSVLVLGPDSFKAIEELKEAKRPVVLDSTLDFRERDALTGALKETFVPKVIHDAGLMFALLPSGDASLAERYQTYQAARCVREGIPRQKALEAITINPAKMLGLGESMGSLEVGKSANVTIYSGDPLDFNSWVEKVYIDGILAYDRAKDVRIRRLFQPPGIDEKPDAESDKPKSDAAKPAEAGPGEGEAKPSESKPEGEAPTPPKPEEKPPPGEGEKKDKPKDQDRALRGDREDVRRKKDGTRSGGGSDA